jgi:ATP-dependent phosphofructokinase / diphosphate-dependent phosphofructokinase
MTTPKKHIAINFSGGFVPGLNAIIKGAVLAASELGWKVTGIRDGYDGLLFPDRYSDGGLEMLTSRMVENLSGVTGCVLGTTPQSDPFRVRRINAESQVEEVDRSDELLEKIRAAKIDAVISVVGPQELSILFKLHRKGLKTVCVPTSVQNDVAATQLSFGFNSALSFAVDMIERARQAAQSARKIGVIEVPGNPAGWLALQAAMAVCADAVLIPEIPYDIQKVAAKLRQKIKEGRTYGLVVVAEGAIPREGQQLHAEGVAPEPLKASLSPGATGPGGSHVIDRSGTVAQTVALELQRLTDMTAYPLVLGQWVKGGTPTAVDQQLGIAYGAGAVRGLEANQDGVMVAFIPPDLEFVPFKVAINRIRTVPADSVFIKTARSLGISLGECEATA